MCRFTGNLENLFFSIEKINTPLVPLYTDAVRFYLNFQIKQPPSTKDGCLFRAAVVISLLSINRYMQLSALSCHRPTSHPGNTGEAY